MRGVLLKRDEVEIYESAAKVWIEKVSIADDVMVLAIIIAKLEKSICETGYDKYISTLDVTITTTGTTTPSQEEDQSDDASMMSTRKCKKKHGRG